MDFENETDSVGKKILDSLTVDMLVSELCDKFDIEITPPDIIPENFSSTKAVGETIKRLEYE